MDFYKTENIKKYVEGKLSSTEKKAFEDAFAADAFLKDAVEGYRMMQEDGVNFDDLLQQSRYKIAKREPANKIKIINWRTISIAATVLILISFSFYYFSYSKLGPSDFDFKDAGLPVHLDDSNQMKYTQFTNFYKLNELDSANKSLEVLLKNNPANDTLLYYKACVLKEQKLYEDAIKYFSLIQPGSTFIEKAEYQKAMCYWYLKDKGKFEESMELISKKPSHLFYNQSLLIRKSQ